MQVVNKKIKIVIIMTLMLIEICSLYFCYRTFNNKEIKIDDVKLKDVKSGELFAIMLEQEDGTYNEQETFPTSDYIYNKEKSGCIDINGERIEGILSYDSSSNKAIVDTGQTSYCYLYFDILKLTKGTLGRSVYDKDKENINYAGEMYRYQGTNEEVTNNYICFGTSEKATCTGNTDKYMYRIIGITEDGKLKLIKKEALNTAYSWYSDSTTDITWSESDLYKGLNGISGGTYSNIFVGSSNYSYMATSSDWYNKIVDTSWKYGDEKYARNFNGDIMYGYENAWTSTTSAKIGLWYVHDYYYAYEGGIPGSASEAATSWIHLNNNDSGAPHTREWSMTRYGLYSDDNSYRARLIFENGDTGHSWISNSRTVRPVFYVDAAEVLKGGMGTESNPYLIEGEEYTVISNICNSYDSTSECFTGESIWTSTLEDDGYRYVGTDPNNYICFGTTDTTTCTGNTDLYMYRIIGIFEDSSGEQHLKLIKKEALNTAYEWHSIYSTDKDWDESALYAGLNGSYFLTNTTYSYMQNSTWTNKIVDWDYTAANTKTYESYDLNDIDGTEYGYTAVRNIYLHELNRSGKTNATCYYSSSTIGDCTVGEWKTVNSKIGLMYVSDFALGLGESALDYRNRANYDEYQAMNTAWISIEINDSSAPASYEWTMSRYGYLSGPVYAAYVISESTGVISPQNVTSDYNARPVFYLVSDITLSGTGTIDDPYIIN